MVEWSRKDLYRWEFFAPSFGEGSDDVEADHPAWSGGDFDGSEVYLDGQRGNTSRMMMVFEWL